MVYANALPGFLLLNVTMPKEPVTQLFNNHLIVLDYIFYSCILPILRHGSSSTNTFFTSSFVCSFNVLQCNVIGQWPSIKKASLVNYLCGRFLAWDTYISLSRQYRYFIISQNKWWLKWMPRQYVIGQWPRFLKVK